MTAAQSAVAWRLYAPSASGGKHYYVLLFGTYVLIGWGSVSGTPQYKMHTFNSATAANAFAVEQTSVKEKKGYQLDKEPMASDAPASQWLDWLMPYRSHRGSSTALDRIFRMIFSGGTPLAS